jgi:hypothetical protein
MYKEAKYTLDFLFLFMLVLSIILFSIGFFVEVKGTVLDTLYRIDFVILGGYYAFFLHGMYKAKSRTDYCKKHWIMLALLVLPLVPIARIIKFVELERAAAVSINTLWHFLDELKLL